MYNGLSGNYFGFRAIALHTFWVSVRKKIGCGCGIGRS